MTAHGRRMLEDMRGVLAEVEGPLLDGMPDEERVALVSALQRMAGNLGRGRRSV
ncbi:hypothetical protein GCM10020000_01960 [Streptomyces olivoverticillatus]